MTLAPTQAQGSQPYCAPCCLTSRETGIENSVKKWSSARASVLMLINAYILVKTSLLARVITVGKDEPDVPD